jgi:hypothetical protein
MQHTEARSQLQLIVLDPLHQNIYGEQGRNMSYFWLSAASSFLLVLPEYDEVQR